MREPLFIVAPPRSYTSVVGGMLGQHPQAYGLPEVNLSHGDTLGDLWDAVPIAANYTTAGLLRLLAELHEGCQSEEAVVRARRWVLQRPHWTGARVFAHIREAIGPDRMLVEKSPRNTMEAENLQRLLRIFPRANVLHLTRHPRTQGKSVLDLMKSYGEERQIMDPERNWLRAHLNILKLAEALPPGQYMQIKGEMLLGDPRAYLAQICEWLDLDAGAEAIAAMLHPETSPYARLGPPSAPFGNDPNFLLTPVLDFDRLARITEPPLEGAVAWKSDQAPFSKLTLRLARRFGYA
jgi:hypothetical protein